METEVCQRNFKKVRDFVGPTMLLRGILGLFEHIEHIHPNGKSQGHMFATFNILFGPHACLAKSAGELAKYSALYVEALDRYG